jgi:hypothetical protein
MDLLSDLTKHYEQKYLICICSETLSEVRVLTEDWRAEYNEERPHSSLGDMPPVIYARENWPEILIGGGTKNRRDYKKAWRCKTLPSCKSG